MIRNRKAELQSSTTTTYGLAAVSAGMTVVGIWALASGGILIVGMAAGLAKCAQMVDESAHKNLSYDS
jgi:hypothetical protein